MGDTVRTTALMLKRNALWVDLPEVHQAHSLIMYVE